MKNEIKNLAIAVLSAILITISINTDWQNMSQSGARKTLREYGRIVNTDMALIYVKTNAHLTPQEARAIAMISKQQKVYLRIQD